MPYSAYLVGSGGLCTEGTEATAAITTRMIAAGQQGEILMNMTRPIPVYRRASKTSHKMKIRRGIEAKGKGDEEDVAEDAGGIILVGLPMATGSEENALLF